MLHFLLQKYPDLRFQDCYVDGNDWSVGNDTYRADHPAMQFIATQLDFMRTQGLSKKEAFAKTEDKFRERREKLEADQKVFMAMSASLQEDNLAPMFATGQAYLRAEKADIEATHLKKIIAQLRRKKAAAMQAKSEEKQEEELFASVREVQASARADGERQRRPDPAFEEAKQDFYEAFPRQESRATHEGRDEGKRDEEDRPAEASETRTPTPTTERRGVAVDVWGMTTGSQKFDEDEDGASETRKNIMSTTASSRSGFKAKSNLASDLNVDEDGGARQSTSQRDRSDPDDEDEGDDFRHESSTKEHKKKAKRTGRGTGEDFGVGD